MMRIAISIALSLCVAIAHGFESGRATFSVRVNDLEIPYRIFAVYALPAELLHLSIDNASVFADAELAIDSGELLDSLPAAWRWRTPTNPGVTELRIRAQHDEIRLNVIVMHPAAHVRNERLNGYRIGAYPAEPLNGDPLYLPPDGFVELGQSTTELLLSPHFRLSQFPSKQAGGHPKYLALREQLLLKLELLLEEINARGIAADSLTIMSGFRTPFYNAAIGNVPYSRHVFGGAADVFVDVSPVDNYMDDLTRDGVLDYRDAQWLFRVANELFRRPENSRLVGGLGVYARTSAHGPFLHVDARGRRARWGLLPE
jgi:hypothetical protein